VLQCVNSRVTFPAKGGPEGADYTAMSDFR
jgi:hypothetical protein